MDILRIVLQVLFIIVCIALTVIVLMQEASQVSQILTGERIRDVPWRELS